MAAYTTPIHRQRAAAAAQRSSPRPSTPTNHHSDRGPTLAQSTEPPSTTGLTAYPLILELPWPPSANTYWRSGLFPTRQQLGRLLTAARSGAGPLLEALHAIVPRVMLSKEARKYRTQAAQYCLLQNAAGLRLRERLDVTLELTAPTKRACDVDNYQKPTLDSLTSAGVWLDDSQIDRLETIRRTPAKPGWVRVHIRPFENGTI